MIPMCSSPLFQDAIYYVSIVFFYDTTYSIYLFWSTFGTSVRYISKTVDSAMIHYSEMSNKKAKRFCTLYTMVLGDGDGGMHSP